jgi:hypothetical protein
MTLTLYRSRWIVRFGSYDAVDTYDWSFAPIEPTRTVRDGDADSPRCVTVRDRDGEVEVATPPLARVVEFETADGRTVSCLQFHGELGISAESVVRLAEKGERGFRMAKKAEQPSLFGLEPDGPGPYGPRRPPRENRVTPVAEELKAHAATNETPPWMPPAAALDPPFDPRPAAIMASPEKKALVAAIDEARAKKQVDPLRAAATDPIPAPLNVVSANSFDEATRTQPDAAIADVKRRGAEATPKTKHGKPAPHPWLMKELYEPCTFCDGTQTIDGSKRMCVDPPGALANATRRPDGSIVCPFCERGFVKIGLNVGQLERMRSIAETVKGGGTISPPDRVPQHDVTGAGLNPIADLERAIGHIRRGSGSVAIQILLRTQAAMMERATQAEKGSA